MSCWQKKLKVFRLKTVSLWHCSQGLNHCFVFDVRTLIQVSFLPLPSSSVLLKKWNSQKWKLEYQEGGKRFQSIMPLEKILCSIFQRRSEDVGCHDVAYIYSSENKQFANNIEKHNFLTDRTQHRILASHWLKGEYCALIGWKAKLLQWTLFNPLNTAPNSLPNWSPQDHSRYFTESSTISTSSSEVNLNLSNKIRDMEELRYFQQKVSSFSSWFNFFED